MSEPPFDLAKAHRWFAIELNNLAWELCELPARTADETLQMIDAAHASVHHWRQAGTALNFLRGQVLLATCHAAAGDAACAHRHAASALEQLPHAEGATAFDRVSVFGSAAVALAMADKPEEAERLRGDALAALSELTDEDDRRVARQWWKLD